MAIGLADLVWVRPTQELGCLVRGIAAGGCDRSWSLRGQSGSGFGQSVDGLAELDLSFGPVTRIGYIGCEQLKLERKVGDFATAGAVNLVTRRDFEHSSIGIAFLNFSHDLRGASFVLHHLPAL